jgi:hypothetical protein
MVDDDEVDLGAEPEWNEWDTGPFCIHYSDPCDCEEKCAACGHECRQHAGGYPGMGCSVENCNCEEFKRPESKEG